MGWSEGFSGKNEREETSLAMRKKEEHKRTENLKQRLEGGYGVGMC